MSPHSDRRASEQRIDDCTDELDRNRDGAPEPISAEMDELACSLIEYGLDELGEHGEMAPLLAVEDELGNRSLLSFDDEELEECLEEVRTRLLAASEGARSISGLEGRPSRYAVAYDGAIAVPDSNVEGYEPALIVEYGERGMSCAYSAYVLYQNAGNPQEFVWTEPAPAGEGELLV